MAADLDTGLTGFGDPFGQTSANDFAGPALEIEAPVQVREPERAVAAPAAESAAVVQARKLAQLARYGARPDTPLQTIRYFFRVAKRKRELATELAALTSQRKRLELKAEDAMCALGEALYAQRSDARLAALATQFKIVGDTHQQIGSRAAAGKRTVQARRHELDTLLKQAARVEQQAAPFEAQATDLSARLDQGRNRVRELEQQLRKLEAEQKTLKASTQPAALEQISALEAQRDSVRGEIQSLNVELVPLGEDLAGVKREIAKHMDQLAQLTEQQAKLTGAADRDEHRQRIAAGGAASELRDALRSLATAAQRQQLAELAQPALKAAVATEAPIAEQRRAEELMRKAVASFDPDAYRQGMQLVAGGIVGTFVLFVLLIAF